MNEFGNAGVRLKTARIAAGYKTASDFCEKNGISQSTYSHHEKGGRGIGRAVTQYSKLLGVNAAWLLTGEGDAYGCPGNDASNTKPPLNHHEFMELLNCHENPYMLLSNEEEKLDQVNVKFLCHILLQAIHVFQATNVECDDGIIAAKSIEIYKDIIQATSNKRDQYIMVPLAMTTLSRECKKIKSKLSKKKTESGTESKENCSS